MTPEQKLDLPDFLLCESCCWCASYIVHAGVPRCPVCNGSRLARLAVK